MYAIKGFWAILAGFLLVLPLPASTPEATIEYIKPEIQDEPYPQQKFLDFLKQCESGGDPNAINPRDLDGTASFGLYQYKPSTLFYFAHTKYNILSDIEEDEIMNVIFDPDLQIKTTKRMIDDPEVDLSRQFPACYERWLLL